MKNEFYRQIATAYEQHATSEQLKALLGSARAKKGMFEGNLQEGELEIGQVSALIGDIRPAAQIINKILQEFEESIKLTGKIKSYI